jgi:hypothetical protein
MEVRLEVMVNKDSMEEVDHVTNRQRCVVVSCFDCRVVVVVVV